MTVPGSVVSIGDSAFYNSSKLSQAAFADGIETIGNSAFSECYFRGDVVLTLPASLKSVGDSAFDCLTDMSSSATVKVLGKDTALGDAFVPNSTKLTLYGLEGSTAQAYAEKLGDHCKLTFQLLGGETEAAVESVTLPEAVTLTVGSQYRLIAEILPSNATDQNLTWSSEAESYAQVDQTGLVTAIAPGTAMICLHRSSNWAMNTWAMYLKSRACWPQIKPCRTLQ